MQKPNNNSPDCRPAVLMMVYNALDYDGRVQRAADALAGTYALTVAALDSGLNFQPENYRLIAVKPRASRFKLAPHFWFWAAALRQAFRLRPAIVHAHDIFTAWPGWLAAKLCRARLVYDAHELYLPEPGRKMTTRDWFWYALERRAIKAADLVIAANPERARIMHRHYRLSTVPLAVRNISPPPAAIMSYTEVCGRYPALVRVSADQRICIYQGEIDLQRGLARYVEAARHLPGNYRLVLVGGGPDAAALRGLVQGAGLEGKICLIGKVPREHLHDILRQCDVGLITYPLVELNNIYCAPNKIYEYAQAGLPVVATPQPPLRAMVEEYDLGACLEAECGARRIAEVICSVGARGRAAYAGRLARFVAEHPWENEAAGLRAGYARLG